MIYSLINPQGNHYQDNLFLNLFIDKILKIKDFGTVIKVAREDSTEQSRRIDFTLESSKYLIGIEMKIDHHDDQYQISDYYDELIKRNAEGRTNKTVKIYYLTKDGKKASDESLCLRNSNELLKDYTRISFKSHILNWLKKCQYEVQNITNLNEVFNQYIGVVKIITDQIEENRNSFCTFISNNFLMASKVCDNFPDKDSQLKDLLINKDNYKFAEEVKNIYHQIKVQKIEEAFNKIGNVGLEEFKDDIDSIKTDNNKGDSSKISLLLKLKNKVIIRLQYDKYFNLLLVNRQLYETINPQTGKVFTNQEYIELGLEIPKPNIQHNFNIGNINDFLIDEDEINRVCEEHKNLTELNERITKLINKKLELDNLI